MTHSSLHFQVQQLRAQNLQRTIESLLVFMLSLFVAALLPSILIRYVYANQQLMAQPPLLDYIPVACFVVGVGYFLFAVATNLTREAKAKRLEAEAMRIADSCDDCSCGSSDSEDLTMAMARVEQAASKPATKTSRAKKSTRRK